MAVPNTPSPFSRAWNNGQVDIGFKRNLTGPSVTGYKLYHSTDGVTFSVLATGNAGDAFVDIGGNFSWFPHTGLTNGTTHYYYLTAYNGDGESAPTATVYGTPLDTTDDSLFVWSRFYTGDLPALTMVAGLTYRVDFAFRNIGTSTWTRDNLYRLVVVPNTSAIWSPTRFLLDADASIAPGESGVFSITVTAPSTPGTYDFTWQSCQEFRYPSAFFGDTSPSYSIAVVLLPPDAPESLAADAGDDQVALAWEAPAASVTRPAVTSYSVLRSTRRIDPSTTYAPIPGLGLPPGPGTLDETTIASGLTVAYYNDLTAVNGVDYTYRIVALNAWGASDPSNEASAVPYCCIDQNLPDPAPSSTLSAESMPASTLCSESAPSSALVTEPAPVSALCSDSMPVSTLVTEGC